MIISRGFGLGIASGGDQMVAGALIVIVLCLTVEGVLALVQRLVTPRALRGARSGMPRSAADAVPAGR
jgi:osmoprotectant transport system permease protein